MKIVGKVLILLFGLAAIALIIFQYQLLEDKEAKIKELALQNIAYKTELTKANESIQPKPEITIPKQEPEQAFFDLRNYENRDLGIRFSYPKKWGDVKVIKLQGQSGSSMNLTFANENLIIYANSKDYFEGEVKEIYEIHGFEKTELGISLYYQDNSIDSIELNKYYAQDIQSADMMIVKNQEIYFVQDNLALVAIANNISFQKNQYPGLIFYFNDPTAAQVDQFKKLIDSLYFIQL